MKAYKFTQYLLWKTLPKFIKKIIILDVDLRFRTDLSELYKYFNLMKGSEYIGIAKDWGDFTKETEWFNQQNSNKNIELGAPGMFQHLNSGVVLQDLEKIRANKNLQELFSPIFMNKIVQYLNIPTWGDQILYTLINWKHPDKIPKIQVPDVQRTARNPALCHGHPVKMGSLFQ